MGLLPQQWVWGRGCLDIFSHVGHFSVLPLSLWETPQYRLKYCLKGPLNPRQPTSQCIHHVSYFTGQDPFKSGYSSLQGAASTSQQHFTYKQKKFPCSICGKLFPSKSSLGIHMNIHTGAKPWECDQCGKKFSQKSNLRSHKVTHYRDKFF